MKNKMVKYFRGKIKSVDKEGGTAEVVISDESVDRYKERVRVSSFKKTIKEFMKHPILLSSHTYRGLMNQIGEFTKLKINETDKEVVGTVKYYHSLGNQEADWAWVLAQMGKAAFSIGFIPKERVVNEDPKDKDPDLEYTEIELLEVSQVLIPANPSALQKSFSEPMLKDITQEVVDLNDDAYTELKTLIGLYDKEAPEGKEKSLIEETPPETHELLSVVVNSTDAPTKEVIQEQQVDIKAVEEWFRNSVTPVLDELKQLVCELKQSIGEKAAITHTDDQVDDTQNAVSTLSEEKMDELRSVLFSNRKDGSQSIEKIFDDIMTEMKTKFSSQP